MANCITTAITSLWALFSPPAAPAPTPRLAIPSRFPSTGANSSSSPISPLTALPGIRQKFPPALPFAAAFAFAASKSPPMAAPTSPTMAEPAPASTSSTPAPPPAAEEVAADSALWRQIYLTHLSHLRGHLKFLVGLSTTPAAKGKLEKQIVTAKKAINDAKAAAVIAGLVRPTTTTTTTTEVAPKRKTRPSVTFAEHPEVLGPKKAKTGHARAGAGRGKPSAEMLGRLRSRLGKHGVEVEEGVVEKVVKKGRLAYLQVGDPEGEYLDDEEMRAGLEGEGEAETTTTDTPSASASVSGSKRGKTTTEPSAKKARTTASVPSVFANPAVTPSASSKRAKTSSTASPSSAPTTTTTETPAASSSSAKKTKTDTTPAKDKSAPTTTTTTTPSAPKNTDATTPSTSDTAKKTKTKTPGTRSASKSAKAKQSHAKSPKHAVVVDGAGDVGSREAKKQKKEHYEFVGGRWSRYEGYE